MAGEVAKEEQGSPLMLAAEEVPAVADASLEEEDEATELSGEPDAESEPSGEPDAPSPRDET